jgi:hypothetical protein
VRGDYLVSLGRALRVKAVATCDSGMLDEAVRVLCEARMATQSSSSEVNALTSVGNALFDQYEFTNSADHLHEAASCFEAGGDLANRPSERAARIDST